MSCTRKLCLPLASITMICLLILLQCMSLLEQRDTKYFVLPSSGFLSRNLMLSNYPGIKPSDLDTGWGSDDLPTSSSDISSIFSFSPNISGFTDILDFRLADMINNIRNVGITFARMMMKVEDNEIPGSVKEELVSLLHGNISMEPIKEPLHILLLGTWSSGSTFLTKLITHYPGVFLNFEPMVLIKGYGAVEDPQAGRARSILQSVFQCDYSPGSQGDMLMTYLRKSQYKKWPLHNIRLRNVCEGLPTKDLCLNTEYTAQVCRLHPIQLVKTVRVRVSQVEDLLKDNKGLNLRIIVLFRDPRAVRSSRLRRKSWCNFPACNKLARQCGDQDRDLKDAVRLSIQYPDRLLPVKYEELASRPKDTFPRLFKFLGLPWKPALTKFMADHMVEDAKHNSEGDLHTQSVNSSSKIDTWKKKLSQSELKAVMEECEETIRKHDTFTMTV